MREQERCSSQWYIDAFDGMAGIAFVSWCKPDLYGGDTILDIPAYTIAPPNFQAEVVSSRGVAFAAGARGFQVGLFDKEAHEIGFADIQAVEEFVRRLYIALSSRGEPEGGGEGSGGDIPGGGGPTEGEGLIERVLNQFRVFGHSTIERSEASVTFKEINWDGIVGINRSTFHLWDDHLVEHSHWLIQRALEILSPKQPFYFNSLVSSNRLRQVFWPRVLSKGMGIEVNRFSLFDGLRLICTLPQLLEGRDGYAADRLALVFLSASIIANKYYYWMPAMEKEHYMRAWLWLNTQLAKGPFPYFIEEMIEEAVRVERNNPEPEGRMVVA